MQFTIPIEGILWKKAIDFLECRQKWNEIDQYPVCSGRLLGALYQTLSIVVSNAEKKFTILLQPTAAT